MFAMNHFRKKVKTCNMIREMAALFGFTERHLRGESFLLPIHVLLVLLCILFSDADGTVNRLSKRWPCCPEHNQRYPVKKPPCRLTYSSPTFMEGCFLKIFIIAFRIGMYVTAVFFKHALHFFIVEMSASDIIFCTHFF